MFNSIIGDSIKLALSDNKKRIIVTYEGEKDTASPTHSYEMDDFVEMLSLFGNNEWRTMLQWEMLLELRGIREELSIMNAREAEEDEQPEESLATITGNTNEV
jgi:hypothetical protein